MKRILALNLLILGGAVTVLAQHGTLTGKIVSAENGEPLIGANVIVDDTTGTATDIDGNFTITVRPGIHKVLCRFLGCNSETQTIEIKAGENFKLEIALKEKATNLGTVVVSAGKFEQKIEEVTVSMSVISPSLVENKGTTNMETAINQVPGVQIVDSEPQIRSGSGYSFGAGSRVMVMVDDLPILSGDAGRPSWNFLPVENLEQIEIIKGASSVLYGSAALNGVINIRTAYPKDKPQTKINAYTGIYDNPAKKHAIYWDDNNPLYTGANFFHSRKIKNFDLVIGGNIFGDNGYVGSAPEDFTIDTSGNSINVNGTTITDSTYQHLSKGIGEFENRVRANANLRYRHPKITGLDFGVNVNGMYSRFAGALLMLDTDSGMYRAFPGAITKTLKTIYNIDPFVNYYDKKGGRHSLRTRMFYVDNDNSNDQANQSTLYYGQYQYQMKFKKFNDLIVTSGIMGTYSESNSELFMGNESQSPINFARNYAIYSQLDKKFYDRITVSAGVRYETFEINETDKDSKPVFRAGVSSRVLKATFLRASFGQGFRFPTIGEKYIRTSVGPMNIFPNDNITAEESWNAEIGIKQGIKISNFLGYLDVAMFQQQITNSIEFTYGYWGDIPLITIDDFRKNLGFQSINVGLARIRGIDASVVGNGEIGKANITLLAGYTYTQPVTLTPYDTVPNKKNLPVTYQNTSSDTTGNILKYRFEHLVKADLEISYSLLSFGISYRYNSFMKNIDVIFEQLDINSGIPEYEGILPTGITEYRKNRNGKGDYVIDLRLTYQMTETVKAALIVNNALNREYMIRPLNIEAPRTFAIQFTINI